MSQEKRSGWNIFVWTFVAATILFLFPSVARCTSCVTSSQVTLVGTFRGANGIASSNYVMTMAPSQQGYIAGCGVNLPTSFACATSVDGSVVGLPNPLTATINTTSGSGSLTAGVYYTVYEFYDAAGHVTLPSPETRTTLSTTESLVVNPPTSGIPSSAVGMDVFIGTSSGAETLQGQTTGTGAFVQSTALTSGASPATTNTTLCQVTANDAMWPVGTGYNVSLVDSNGNPVPAYPMQWQLLGAGSTYNLSNGLPYYHGVVLYPIPILAQPANHGTQSISGNLGLGGYSLLNAGKVGVGTATPGWPLDVENGVGNFENGFILGGLVPAAGDCPISDGTTYDTNGACASGLNVLNFGAFCDSNGTTGNGHNDRAAIQALLNGLSPTLGGSIIIPAGHICRIASTDGTVNTDYLSVAASNLEITGGGTLFFDPVLVSGHPTFGGALSIITGNNPEGLQIYSPGCALSTVSNPQDITTGRTASPLISNINLHDFALTSVGSYNSLIWNSAVEPGTNIPLNNGGVGVWCANQVAIHNLTISNFYTDAIDAWGVLGLSLSNNHLSGIGFNGIGTGWTSDEEISNNDMLGVGQGFEADALRATFTGNVVSKFSMTGLWAVGGPSAGTHITASFAGNTITRDPAAAQGGYGIKVSCNGATASCIDSANVGPDTISGKLSAGVYVQPGGNVSVHDVTATLTASSGSPVGAIQIEKDTGWVTASSPAVNVLNNVLDFTTSQYQTAVFATGLSTGGVQTIVKNNSITAPSFSAGTPWGVYLYSTGLACQENNISTAATAQSSGCPDLPTGVRADCLSVACVGGSTYVSGTTYTNTGGVSVDEFVGMTVTGSCTGYAATLQYTINSVGQAGNGVYNICAGVSSVSFKVLPGETFSVTAATLSGSGGTPVISSWSEIVE